MASDLITNQEELEQRMTYQLRQYTRADFARVSDFLIRHHQPGNRDGNWLQPAWEYMHSHPALDESALSRIGLWKQAEALVGVVHYESFLGEVFFQVHPDHPDLKLEMLAYAETYLVGERPSGERFIRVYVNDFDHELEALVQARGYHLKADHGRPLYGFQVPHPFPDIRLPEGFRLKSLADENDLSKIHRVLWRGFDHGGEPPEDGIKDRLKMQSGPNFRHDLTLVVAGPTGDFVSFCGMWYEPTNHYAYVEPVATDPDYRRMGLGRAAVLEGIRRCAAEGAEVAYVGSDQVFYKSIGFTKRFHSRGWEKTIREIQAL